MTTKRDSGQELILVSTIGKHFGITARKINSILSDLGWIKKGSQGWVVTELGKGVGGQQSEFITGGQYVRWPQSILDNKIVVNMVQKVKGEAATINPNKAPITDELKYREKFPGTHRADDGHWVKSIAELTIDNWLYRAEVIHAYEKKPRIEEDIYPDFYLPTGNVYIEYWGFEKDRRYSARKEEKLKIYNTHGLRLIELKQEDIKNLDDILPQKLRKYGIETE